MPADVTMDMHETALTNKEDRFVDLLEQYWYMHAKLPTQAELAEQGISHRWYQKCMANKLFRKALAIRGIVDDPDDIRLVSWQLTEMQLAVANTMLDTLDGRSQKKKLSDLQVETQQYQAWLRDPTFQEYLRARSEHYLKDSMADVHGALVDRAKYGDVNAIKTYYELTGRFVPQQARQGQLDPMEVVIKVIEVVSKLVSNQQEVQSVGQALMGIMGQDSYDPTVIQGGVLELEKQIEKTDYPLPPEPKGSYEPVHQEHLKVQAKFDKLDREEEREAKKEYGTVTINKDGMYTKPLSMTDEDFSKSIASFKEGL